MGFGPISVEGKNAVLYEVIKKGKIRLVARSCGVSKPSVYMWLERSQDALRKALEHHKKGPKFKRNPENKQIEKLEDFLKRRDEEINRLKERFKSPKEDFKPVKCLHEWHNCTLYN